MKLIWMVSISIILWTVLAAGVYVITARYGVFIPQHKRNIRFNACFTPNFWRTYCAANSEAPFRVVEFPEYFPPTGTGAIVFSIFGTNRRRYFEPLLRNLKVPVPGWHFRVYIHEACCEWIQSIRGLPNVYLYQVHDTHASGTGCGGAFWRFLPLCEPVDTIILDSDDVLHVRTLLKTWSGLQADGRYSGQVTSVCPWPREHIQAKGIYRKAELTVPFSAHFICSYPHRSSYGSDEVFTTLEIAPHWKYRVKWRRRIASVCVKSLVGKSLLQERPLQGI